jgi:hypothetical protein
MGLNIFAAWIELSLISTSYLAIFVQSLILQMISQAGVPCVQPTWFET